MKCLQGKEKINGHSYREANPFHYKLTHLPKALGGEKWKRERLKF